MQGVELKNYAEWLIQGCCCSPGQAQPVQGFLQLLLYLIQPVVRSLYAIHIIFQHLLCSYAGEACDENSPRKPATETVKKIVPRGKQLVVVAVYCLLSVKLEWLHDASIR